MYLYCAAVFRFVPCCVRQVLCICIVLQFSGLFPVVCDRFCVFVLCCSFQVCSLLCETGFVYLYCAAVFRFVPCCVRQVLCICIVLQFSGLFPVV